MILQEHVVNVDCTLKICSAIFIERRKLLFPSTAQCIFTKTVIILNATQEILYSSCKLLFLFSVPLYSLKGDKGL